MSTRKYRSSKKHSRKRVKRLKTTNLRNKRKPETIAKIGNERKVHEEIISSRITGGIKLTDKEIEQAYSRALEQWLKLPGSVVKTPTDVLLIHKDLKDADADQRVNGPVSN